MHGCAGFDFYADKDKRFLVRHGYAFLAPDSFARQYKPKSCDPMTHTGGFHRGVLEFRLAEASYAHEVAKTLPWVDQKNIFMMGFSEGGITTARYGRGGLAGRIILGWTCHAPWSEYEGISGPPDEPILAVVASKDPWFKNPSLSGDCGRPTASGRKIDSITVEADVHYVQDFPEIQSKIIQFLEMNRRPGN
jgi:dienelactone hydrolase